MTNFDVEKRTIFLTRHGSHSYGLNTPTSDEDFKGICVKPVECYLGFLNRFEQYERMGSKTGGDLTRLESVIGKAADVVIYSVDKFVKLATDCNPTIVEVLHVDDSDIIVCDEFGEELRSFRDEFLSKKAKFTFSGYAHAQLKRIKTHKAWLLNPPKRAPERKDYGLSETSKVSASDLGAFDAVVQQELEVELPKDVMTLFVREKQYQVAKSHWTQYNTWKNERNPIRAALEAKFGYDTKHASHLIRLMRMCKEILSTGKVIVKRPDHDEILSIKNGGWSYDQVIDSAELLEKECEELYQTSTLRKEPDRVKIDKFLVSFTERYLNKHG